MFTNIEILGNFYKFISVEQVLTMTIYEKIFSRALERNFWLRLKTYINL